MINTFIQGFIKKPISKTFIANLTNIITHNITPNCASIINQLRLKDFKTKQTVIKNNTKISITSKILFSLCIIEKRKKTKVLQ
ncbi:MAG: hypothetical protein COA66_12875 [Arcobacter sp.]|nr:MAG: hypothetical protein COA66_12875 [Arcobacter sp.]